ncbi:MAG: ATP-binding protein [Maribacter sp.]|nr:ATP-binding protein [Maribacter sp.]
MNEGTKNRFPLKIMMSYLLLFTLALVAGYFIYSEIEVFMSNDTAEETDVKLLKTSALATRLYEAESLSKLALQNKTQASFQNYADKVDAIFKDIDSLKQLSVSNNQRSLLDSVQLLLRQKIRNSNELRSLKMKNDANTSIDIALKSFSTMEASLGKITAEALAPNINELSPKAQTVIRNLADYLNANIPTDTTSVPDAKKIDSILSISKALLSEAKLNDAKTQRFLSQKEQQINKNDLELSQQLRTILSAFEQEIISNTYTDNIKRQSAMQRSIRLAGIAALLGFLVVGIFTFLINKDFWKIQTYRQNLEKEKKYSESLLKSREQLISTVSHDLRTPLHTISGYADLLENTQINEKQSRYLQNIKSASQYVGNLVNDLLDFSKLEAGKLHVEKVPFVAAELILETAEHVESLYRDKKLTLLIDIDPQLKKVVVGDPFRIRQILTNLIGNAFKFTEDGSITIKASGLRRLTKVITLKIDVIDTGIGIPKEKQSIIFKEFAQADRATEKKFGGYGLGLTISKKLAELLKGSLSVESKIDEGSVFTLKIPLEINSSQESNPTKKSYLVPKLRMLIIDDDTALLGMLKELAESMGAQVRTFTNFLQIDNDSHLAYDLVLTDIQMPQINGFEVLKKLQSGRYKHFKNQPIIAMTGRKDLDAEAYISLGFTQVIQKPFSKGELLSILNLLGFETTKAQENSTNSTKPDSDSAYYSLEVIQSFLGDNEAAIQEVLQTFVNDTFTNISLLEEFIDVLDYVQINHITHRMLPMFRQLHVHEAIPILEKFELAEVLQMNPGQLRDAFGKLKVVVTNLLTALKNRLSISPSYNG